MSRARDTADQINRVNSSAADATAITVDSSENVLVGKTSASSTTAGFQTSQDGQTAINRSGTALQVGRLSSDGDIAVFRKDGTTVVSIGTTGNQSYIHGAGTDVGIYFGSSNLYPYRSTGLNDATIDLGQSGKRFKDLYLSGGIYLGGTGSANKLEDYEEGTWTPTSPTVTLSSAHGNYTKIGNRVFLDATFVVPSTSSGVGVGIQGVPFNQSGTSAAAGFYVRYTNDSTFRMLYISNGATISMYNLGGVGTALSEVSGHRFDFSGTYQTDS